MNRKKPCEIG